MLKPRLEVPDEMIFIVSREEKRKRDIKLGKIPTPAVRPHASHPVAKATPVEPPLVVVPAPPPVPKPKPAPPKKSKEERAAEAEAQLEQCGQILEVVCPATLSSPTLVRDGSGLAEHVLARRITAHIARNYLSCKVPYRIIAKATGLKNAHAVCKGYSNFNRKVEADPHLKERVRTILSQLRAQNILPESQL